MGERVWVRGRPIRGFIGGLFFGLGVALIAHAFKFVPFDDVMFSFFPLGSAVLFGLRAYLGTAYRVGEVPEDDAVASPAEAPSIPPEAPSGA